MPDIQNVFFVEKLYTEGENMKKNKLTPRETEIMNLLIKGYNNPDISKKLKISPHTTKAHLASIYGKFNANNRIEAIIMYIKENKDILDKSDK